MAPRTDPLRKAWWLLTPLALYYGVLGLRLACFGDATSLPTGFVELPLMYRVHMGLGGVALLLGPFQFLPALLRRGRRRWHRVQGRVYVLACLLGALTALPMTWKLQAFGVETQLAFGLLAVLWFAFTGIAVQRILRGQVVAHRAFMVRSFALAFAAVTLRLFLRGMERLDVLLYADTYRIAAWVCWIPNLVVAEWWLRRTQGGRAAQERRGAAGA